MCSDGARTRGLEYTFTVWCSCLEGEWGDSKPPEPGCNPPFMAAYIGKGGQVGTRGASTGGGGITSSQKGLLALAAVLVGPSLLKTLYDKPKKVVDLSSYNIVTRYDTPGEPPRLSTDHVPAVFSIGQS